LRLSTDIPPCTVKAAQQCACVRHAHVLLPAGGVIAKFRVRRGAKKLRSVPPRTGSKLALSRQASLHMRTVRSKQTSGDSISAVKAAVPKNSPRHPIKPEKVPILFGGDFAFPSRPTLAETTSGFVWPNRHRRRGGRAACRLPNPGLPIKGIGGPPCPGLCERSTAKGEPARPELQAGRVAKS